MMRGFFDVLFRGLLLGACALTLFVLATGCSLVTSQGPTVQLDPDVDDRLGGTGPESGDIRGASEQIARGIIGAEGKGQRIAIAPVKNLSRFRVDPGLLQNRLTHDLASKARGRFQLTSDATAADLVLLTEMRSLTKDNGGTTSDYVQYAFTLHRPKDGAVMWTGIYETKRASDVDVVYQ